MSGALAAPRAEHPCILPLGHPSHGDGGFDVSVDTGRASRNNSTGVCVLQPLTCNDKGRGAGAANPPTVCGSGEILLFGFGGES